MNDGALTLAADRVADLLESAKSAAANAYAPYSGFRVGAALLLRNGAVVTGANVENASFGLTLCAERSAVARAVNEHGPLARILAIAVTNLNSADSAPCGACRQVLAEFAEPHTQIFFPYDGKMVRIAFKELLPFPFGLAEKL